MKTKNKNLHLLVLYPRILLQSRAFCSSQQRTLGFWRLWGMRNSTAAPLAVVTPPRLSPITREDWDLSDHIWMNKRCQLHSIVLGSWLFSDIKILKSLNQVEICKAQSAMPRDLKGGLEQPEMGLDKVASLGSAPPLGVPSYCLPAQLPLVWPSTPPQG